MKKYNAVIVFFILLIFFVWFSNWLVFHYQFPPGDDAAVHIDLSEKLLNNQWSTYPPALHILADCLYLITGLSLFKIYIFFPLLLLGVLTPLVFFLIFKRLGNWKKALIIAPLFIFLLPRAAEMYAGGQFPEITAVFLAAVLILTLFQKKYALALFFIIPILLTHHLTSIPLIISLILYNIFTNPKKTLWFILVMFVLAMIIILIWPFYFTVFSDNVTKIFISNQSGGTINIKNLLELWTMDKVYVLFILSGFFYGIFIYKKEKRPEIMFLLVWCITLFLLSQIDFETTHLSNRLARQMMFPVIFIASCGLLFFFNKINNNKVKIFVISLIYIFSLTRVISVINQDYSFINSERIKNDDLLAFDYIKKNTALDANILLPGASITWYGYFGKRNFILIDEKNNPKQQKYWDIVNGLETNSKTVKSLGVDYIFQVSPQAFMHVPYEKIDFKESDLLKTGLWEKVFENSRVRIYKFTSAL